MAMVDLLTSRMTKMFDKHEERTAQKFEHVQTQIEIVANATDECVTTLTKQCDETQQQLKELTQTVTNIQNTLELR